MAAASIQPLVAAAAGVQRLEPDARDLVLRLCVSVVNGGGHSDEGVRRTCFLSVEFQLQHIVCECHI